MEDEVLFLTSRDRIYDAYLRWYNEHPDVYPPPEARENAIEMSRALMRYLRIPTVSEIERYREEPIQV